MYSQDFAWDSENKRFFYINHVERRFVEINIADQPEVYEFLMHVYGVNWRIIKDRIVDYKKCLDMNQTDK